MRTLDYSDLTNQVTAYAVDAMSTDAAQDQKETEWNNSLWTTYFGYYKQIPELKAAIDAKATWTVGKGFTADPTTTMILSAIDGFGKDTFNTILENMIRTYHIAGDSFAEIITNTEGVLLNLKPLDPGTITIVANRQGRIIRYEQNSKVKGSPKKKFTPNKILHLAYNRVADEIHGVSMIKALEQIILMRNEAMTNYKQVMQRYLKPRYIFHLDTDDDTTIATFKAKMDAAWKYGENVYIPKGAVVPEQMSIAPNSTISPLAWIESLNQYFFQATGVPDIIVGSSKALTEASAKIAYLAFQQTIEEEQLYIEEQILKQLNYVIELTFPVSLENEALSDKPKQEAQVQQPNIQQNESAVEANDTKVEMEGRK